MADYSESIESTLDISDDTSSLGAFNDVADDAIGLTEEHEFTWLVSLQDDILAEESHGIGFGKTITESMFVYDRELGWTWKMQTTDELALAVTLSDMLGIMVSEWIWLIDSEANSWNGKEPLSDIISLYDLSELYLRYENSNTDAIGLTDEATLTAIITILEYLGFQDLITTIRQSAVSASDTINVTDTIGITIPAAIEDILSAIDTSTLVTRFVNAVIEDIALSDTSSNALVGFLETLIENLMVSDTASDKIIGFLEIIYEALNTTDNATFLQKLGELITDNIVLIEDSATRGVFYSAIYDTLRMSLTVELEGEVWECYALNTPKFYPSMYSGYNFNSYCVFENRAFAANETGIYELDGDTDAGAEIHTGIILNQTDFGFPNQKRFRRGYFGITGAHPVVILEADNGEREVYAINDRGKSVMSHGLKAKKWTLSVADFDTLDIIKLIPIMLSK